MHTFVRLLSIGLLTSLAGCFAFSDVKRPELVEDTGTSEEGGTDAEPPCTRDPEKGELPCAPVNALAGGSQEITFAIETVRLTQDPDDPDGLDLDGYDSSLASGNAGYGECQAGDPVGSTGVDGPFGIDNTLGLQLWPYIGGNFSLECEAEKVHRKGQGTILLHVTDWNGFADDERVQIMVAPAVLGTFQPGWDVNSREDAQAAAGSWTWGLEQIEVETSTGVMEMLEFPYAEISPGERPPEPCWLEGGGEADWFFANPLYFDSLTKIPRISVVGYISDHWLVVPLPNNSSFDLFTDRRGVQVKLRYSHIVARMSPDFSSFETAFVAGRFAINDMVAVSPEIGLCGMVPESYLPAADLFANPDAEGLTPDMSCASLDDQEKPIGAISVGVGFEARRVSYGGIAGAAAGWSVPNACDSPTGTGRSAPTDCGNGTTVPRTWFFTPGAHCPPQ